MHQDQKHQEIHCNNLTHMTTLGILIYLSGNSHILENAAYLAHGLIGYPSGNKNSLYLDKMFSSFNFSWIHSQITSRDYL